MGVAAFVAQHPGFLVGVALLACGLLTVRIALASPRVTSSVEDGLEQVRAHLTDAARQGAAVVCFPEAYLPGLRGQEFDVPPFGAEDQARILRTVGQWAREVEIAVILGMEWHTPAGRNIAAAVLDATGTFLGAQTKTQLDPTEEAHYVPGHGRQIFETGGLRFGIAICHEGFRYPETVRWAARRGAHVVFHPHCTGSDRSGPALSRWGSPEAPYYERAVMCRALENTIYVASTNVGFRYPESATAVLGPDGTCLAHLPYGEPGTLIADLDLDAATGLLASRYAPERYTEAGTVTSPR